jgi:hypothetical protein
VYSALAVAILGLHLLFSFSGSFLVPRSRGVVPVALATPELPGMAGELLGGRIDRRAAQTRPWQLGPIQITGTTLSATVLSLPNMFTAGAVHGIPWFLLG